jgi:heptosyltransferase-2
LKILIIKIAAIGDVVMALPMIDAIRKMHPDARITWLCGKTVAPLLEMFEGIDELIVIDERNLLTGTVKKKVSSLVAIWKKLFGRHFDLIATGHADPRYRLLSLTAIGGKRISFQRCRKRLWPVPGRHHTDEYLRLITNEERCEASQRELPKLSLPLAHDLDKLILKGRPVVALAPGGARNLLRNDAVRRWPLECYADLAAALVKHRIQVIVTGAPSDEWVSKSFVNIDIVNLVGKTSVIDLIAVYGACDLIVTHDSSPLHLAGLVDKPVVALFGPTNPYEKVPHNNKSTVLWGGKNLTCRPCYDGKTYADCTDNVCMQGLKVQRVYEAVISLLPGKG